VGTRPCDSLTMPSSDPDRLRSMPTYISKYVSVRILVMMEHEGWDAWTVLRENGSIYIDKQPRDPKNGYKGCGVTKYKYQLLRPK